MHYGDKDDVGRIQQSACRTCFHVDKTSLKLSITFIDVLVIVKE
jgi:hypothetical protein